MSKVIGRPRVSKPDDPLVQLVITVRKSDLNYILTVDSNKSKAVRTIIDQHKQHKKGTTHHG